MSYMLVQSYPATSLLCTEVKLEALPAIAKLTCQVSSGFAMQPSPYSQTKNCTTSGACAHLNLSATAAVGSLLLDVAVPVALATCTLTSVRLAAAVSVPAAAAASTAQDALLVETCKGITARSVSCSGV